MVVNVDPRLGIQEAGSQGSRGCELIEPNAWVPGSDVWRAMQAMYRGICEYIEILNH